MNKQLPVLVYGTLREGELNYPHFVAPSHHTIVRGLTLNGFRMHAGWGFPYLVHGTADDTAVVDLITFSPEDYDDAMEGLDGLEGYHGDNPLRSNHYDRLLVLIALPDETTIEAYVYVASAARSRSAMTLPYVEHGDWIRHRKERKVETMVPSASGRVNGRYFSAFGPVEED